jgi:hypothetical protein
MTYQELNELMTAYQEEAAAYIAAQEVSHDKAIGLPYDGKYKPLASVSKYCFVELVTLVQLFVDLKRAKSSLHSLNPTLTSSLHDELMLIAFVAKYKYNLKLE